MKWFNEALKLRLELVRSNPKDVRSASILAATKLRIGSRLVELRKGNEGIQLLHESLQSREQLSAKDPKNSRARGEIAEACAALGDAYLKDGKRRLAREHYKRAHAIFGELRSQSTLSADFLSEPDRISAAMEKIGAIS
jgi:tetratricopeptide (TPR) repeat protein